VNNSFFLSSSPANKTSNKLIYGTYISCYTKLSVKTRIIKKSVSSTYKERSRRTDRNFNETI